MKHIEVIVKASQKGNTISCSEVWVILFLYANFHPKYLSTNKLSDIFINAVRVFVLTEILFSNLLIIQVVVWTQESMKIKVQSLIVRYIIDEPCLFFFFFLNGSFAAFVTSSVVSLTCLLSFFLNDFNSFDLAYPVYCYCVNFTIPQSCYLPTLKKKKN